MLGSQEECSETYTEMLSARNCQTGATYKTIKPQKDSSASSVALLQAELRMETCPVLMLRKILNPEKPRHQAIIDRLTGAADSSSDDDSDDQPSVHRVKPEQVARQSQPHASTLTHATSPVRVKPEPQALRKRKRKAALPNPNVLDLTASGSDRSTSEPAELQANVCDLTGKADFPRWSIRPTQRVKIE